MLLSTSFFTVIVTLTLGYLIIQKLFPDYNREIEIAKAFKNQEYEKVYDLTENKIHNMKNSLNMFVFAAQTRKYLSKYQEALVWFETVLTRLELIDSDKIFIETEIGDIYVALGDLKQAEIHYRTAVSINKNHIKANYSLGSVLFQSKKYDSCRKILRELLKVNPSLIDARKIYAECLVAMNQYTKAIRHYGILERQGEDILSYNYANTLKKIKRWDKAYSAFSKLLEQDNVKNEAQIICALVKITIIMKQYHKGLGIIENYLSQLSWNTDIQFELKYMRATIFYLRGDKMTALQEYKDLYANKPFYKDLSIIIDKDGHWLAYPFLYNYFTSNESIFETVITRLIPAGLSIIRRSLEYYLGIKDQTVYLFYRDMNEIPEKITRDVEIFLAQLPTEIETLEVWCLRGIKARYSVAGTKYRVILLTEKEFLENIKLAVDTMKYQEVGTTQTFKQGFEDAPQIIPIVENILNSSEPILDDELLDRALDG